MIYNLWRFGTNKPYRVAREKYIGDLQVGRPFWAMSISSRDGWSTTEVTEIYIDEPDLKYFRTFNSFYALEQEGDTWVEEDTEWDGSTES
jgi:hypothetical protein